MLAAGNRESPPSSFYWLPGTAVYGRPLPPGRGPQEAGQQCPMFTGVTCPGARLLSAEFMWRWT